jgi:signal transduction histidine kinase
MGRDRAHQVWERDGVYIGAHHVELRTDLRPAPITGDPVLLDRMVSNLIDNAIRYNEAGGHITAITSTAAGHAELRNGVVARRR